MPVVQRLVATFLIFAIVVGGIEFVVDYDEAFAGTPLHHLAGSTDEIPLGNETGDSCDNCHFGGIHLTGLVVNSGSFVIQSRSAAAPGWKQPSQNWQFYSPPHRPPIT